MGRVQPQGLQASSGRGSARVPRPDPFSLTQVSLQPRATPDPRAKPAGVTMPSPQASLVVPGGHCLCGRGLLPDLEPRGGTGLTHFQRVGRHIRKT